MLVVSQTAGPVGHGSCGDVSRRRGGLLALRRFPMMAPKAASYASRIVKLVESVSGGAMAAEGEAAG
jgi:hypothetical protein